MESLYYKKHKIFFLALKTAYQKKQKFFFYPSKNEHLIGILKKLQEKSLITGYVSGENSVFQVFLRYDMQNVPAMNYIFLFPKNRYIS